MWRAGLKISGETTSRLVWRFKRSLYPYLEYIFLSTIKVLSQSRQCCEVKLCQYHAHIFYINLCWICDIFQSVFFTKIDNILSLDKFFSSVWLVKTSAYSLVCKLGCRVSGLIKKMFARFLIYKLSKQVKWCEIECYQTFIFVCFYIEKKKKKKTTFHYSYSNGLSGTTTRQDRTAFSFKVCQLLRFNCQFMSPLR